MKTNLYFRILSIYSKQTLFIFYCFISSFLFAQNPKLISSPLPSGSGRSIEKIIDTKNGHAFFNTVDRSNHFSDLWGLWTTDGTQAGTTKLILNSPGYTNTKTKEATMLTPLGNDKIVFAGDNEYGYGELWVSDGTEQGTTPLQIFTTAFSGGAVTNIVSLGNIAIYSAYANGAHSQLGKTDGTPGGTSMIYDFGSNPANPNSVAYFKTIGNLVYFELTNGVTHNNEIWRTDGTTAGTYQVKDLGKDYGFASDFMPFKNNIYFTTISSAYGDYIWQSDGTNAGTAPLKQISTTFNSDNLFPSYAAVENSMIPANNLLYFTANDGSHGRELWRTDGTASGTKMTFDFYQGSIGSNPSGLTILNNLLYFTANSNLFPQGSALYSYDGSKFSQPIGNMVTNPTNLTFQKNMLLFCATNATGTEFWLSDGSTANTIEIADIAPGAASSNPSLITASEGLAYFVANYDANRDGKADEPCIFKYTAPDKIWTGSVNSDMSAIDNWFPSGSPSQTDNVLISPTAANNLTAPSFLSCNGFINNGGTVDVKNGLIFINGDFYNAGVINNNSGGVFAIIGNANHYHSVGSPGVYNGVFTASSNVIMHLSADSKFPSLRIEGADTIHLGDYNLTVNDYVIYKPTIIADGGGMLYMPVGTTPVLFNFPNAVTITNNGNYDYFGVSVKDHLYTNGLSGDTIKTQAINKTWDISKQTAGIANVNIALQWNVADELPGFDRNHIYLNHYTLGKWDPGNAGSASGSGPFTISRNNITSFSPFSITSSATILPVNLVSFAAKKSNNTVQLNWQTTSEKNASFYLIERSADDNNYSSIGKVNADSNNLLTHYYSFTDFQPLQGDNFYRLKMIDLDGKFSYSKIIVIKMDALNAFILFPNPAKDFLNIQVSGNNESALLEITDMAGRKVKEEKIILNGNTSVSIGIHNLSKGTYNLMLKSKSVNEQRKFVKE